MGLRSLLLQSRQKGVRAYIKFIEDLTSIRVDAIIPFREVDKGGQCLPRSRTAGDVRRVHRERIADFLVAFGLKIADAAQVA